MKGLNIVLFISALLSACTLVESKNKVHFQAAPPPASQSALLYIYRPSSSVLDERKASFFINGKRAGVLSDNGYMWMHLPAGKYTLKQSWPWDVSITTTLMNFRVKAGAESYFRFKTEKCENKPINCAIWRMSNEIPDKAKEEIKSTLLESEIKSIKI